MEAWLHVCYGLFLHLFGRATSNETYVVVTLCLMLGALALSRVSTSLGAIGAFYTTGLILTVLGIALLVAAMAAPQALGCGFVLLPLLAAILMFLGVILPLTILFQKGGYITALIAWMITLLTIGVILTLEPKAMNAINKYIEKTTQIEKHRINTENYK
jgi:membrane-bound ClpP family serine protease